MPRSGNLPPPIPPPDAPLDEWRHYLDALRQLPRENPRRFQLIEDAQIVINRKLTQSRDRLAHQ